MGPQGYEVDQKGRVVVPINSFSDGDPSAWPQHSNCVETDATVYLEKLGMQWMKERGECQQGQYPFKFPSIGYREKSCSYIDTAPYPSS